MENVDFFKSSIINVSNAKKAEINAKKLVAHIQSLFSLVNINLSDQAAILADLMRIVGRSLLDEKTIPMTNANTQCLAAIGSQFERPNGFVKKLGFGEEIVIQENKSNIPQNAVSVVTSKMELYIKSILIF